MLKRTFVLCTALLMLLCCAVPASAVETDYFVFDLADILTSSEAAALNDSAAEISARYSCGVYIITVEDMNAYGFRSIEKFAEFIYQEWELGYDDDGTGILLVMSMAERDYDLAAYGDNAHLAFTDYGKSALADTFLDDFRGNDWADGFADYIVNAGALLERAANGDPLDVAGYNGPAFIREKTLPEKVGTAMVPGLAVGLIAAFIYCSVLKSKMKSAKPAVEADDYVSQNGVDVRVHEDRFSHTTQVRQKIEHSSGSRGGGGGSGGTHISSGGFSHSSGKF